MDNIFITGALATLVFMLVMFVIATIKKDNSIVDVGWGLGFILIAVTALIKAPLLTPQNLLITSLITIWGLRLSIYIFIRNHGTGEDYRYAQWRKEWGKYVVLRAFFQVFMLQGVFMYIIALPVMVVTGIAGTDLNIITYPGFIVWLVGFFFEAVGDWQKSVFKKNPANQGRIMTSGLWSYTRHPNYFGEAMMWWGIFIISFPSGHWYISIISPLMLTFLLTKVSGVAMLEKKYAGSREFEEYARRTSAFIPLPPKK